MTQTNITSGQPTKSLQSMVWECLGIFHSLSFLLSWQQKQWSNQYQTWIFANCVNCGDPWHLLVCSREHEVTGSYIIRQCVCKTTKHYVREDPDLAVPWETFHNHPLERMHRNQPSDECKLKMIQYDMFILNYSGNLKKKLL